jgi:Spy/CpxP family protein refolding chaperone
VRTTLLVAALAITAATAAPIVARSAEHGETEQAQAAPMGEHWGDEHARMGHWMRGHHDGRPMMHRMMESRDPQERCVDRLAWRAARRAYVETKLDLTAEQRPLWDKVQSAAQAEEQKERQLCASLKPGTDQTLLGRMDRMQQFLSARLDGLQSAKPSVQALYQSLTPEQKAIFDHPFRR